MDSKLQILLDKINLNHEYYKNFDGSKLNKIVGNKSRDSYCFFIECDNTLDIDVYDIFMACLNETFKDYKDITVSFKCKNINYDIIDDYFKYFLNKYSSKSSMLEMFVDNKIEHDNNVIIIYVGNIVEEKKLMEYKSKLISDLFNVGYSVDINIIIDNNESEILNEEINKSIEQNSFVISDRMNKKDEVVNENPYKKKFTPKPIETVDDPKAVLGRIIDTQALRMDTITGVGNNITVEAEIFGIDVRETKTDFRIITLKITDHTDSMYAKIFVNGDPEVKRITGLLKNGKWYKFRGNIKEDKFSGENTLNLMDINISEKVNEERFDDAPVKRVELHAHTMMSQMDGITNLDLGKHTCELVEKTIKMGYRGVAITDHSGCQAFPISFGIIKKYNKGVRGKIKDAIASLKEQISENGETDELKKELEKQLELQKNPPIFKGLYGTELTLVDDTVVIVVRPTDDALLEQEYVVFDTETTGFNAGGSDQMIEIGAVKIKDGVITDRFDELIDPGRHIPDKITELTQITDEMVMGKSNEEEVTRRFLEWTGNAPMVAHNAKFDISFIEMAMKKYNIGEFKNTVIDTLELSRTLDQGFARHGLSALVKRYNVPWEEDAHHRADYDAEGTALVFAKMLKKLDSLNFDTIKSLDKLVSKDEIHKFGRTFHFNAIALNQKGLKNLFEIISLANTVYIYKTPRILRSKLNELREGLLIGSGCYESEVFNEARSKDGEELTNIINFYDYVEVQPIEVYDHLIQMSDFKSKVELQEHIKKIINATREAGKIIVATGDVHHFNREDKIFREIIVNQKVPGGGRHPLARKEITNIPCQHFRTTREMLDDFEFLGDDLAYEIVVTNTNKVLDMVDELVVTDLVYDKAAFWYGDPLPYSIEERIATELYGDIVLNTIKKQLSDLEGEELTKEAFKRLHEVIVSGSDNVKSLVREQLKIESEEELSDDELEKKLKKSLGGVIGAGFDPIYLIAQRLVKHSNDEGFLVGSRGSVGSSFVATLMGITEVNPLSAHYRCSKCKLSIFDDDNGNSLGATYSSGFDLPDKMCPNCNIPLIKDGQDMPFATFLGFNADKVPDIDLNFSDLNQASTHAYTKVLFGPDNVYRAGTIGTVADKTAFGFVKGYCEDKNIVMNTAEVERLAIGCTGVKRTTGQHPGGIVVIPDYKDCFDFTPFQFPAEDPTSEWRTTHFDYHSIEECVLKLDILGHSDPTQLRLIQLQSGTDIMKVPLDDKDTMSIFTSTKALGVTTDQIMCNTGTLGIPEFGTPFTIKLVEDTKPTTFAELIKISGLSHGTDVWLGNAQELIQNNVVPFKETIGCRDDIMVYLMYKGVKPIKAFKIMEFVRKGKASKDPETWKEHVKTMEEANIPDWFIGSCQKIKYMFPKAHAAAYVISAFRIAWYKVHMPVYFYASWYSSKATDVDVEAMIKGYNSIRERIIEIQEKGYDATNKENGQAESLKIALEASARGIKFLNVDLYKSEATVWVVNSDNEIYPPFSAIDGLGETVAKNIVEERKKRSFLSVEEVQTRAKISGTLIDKMRSMGIFDGMDESNQLSLF